MVAYPGPIPGCPEGLEYLAAVDHLICYELNNLEKVITKWDISNQFRIMNKMLQQVYFVEEESDKCQRQCCRPQRGFQLHVLDNIQQEVMTISRTFSFRCCSYCNCCWCADGCCLYPIEIFDKHKQKLGMLRLMNSFYAPHYGIFDSNDDLLYEIWGSICPLEVYCGFDTDFPIRSVKDGSKVGNLAKVWPGALKEMHINVDSYRLTFLMDLDIRHKALMIGTFFLIDFSMFNKQRRRGRTGF